MKFINWERKDWMSIPASKEVNPKRLNILDII